MQDEFQDSQGHMIGRACLQKTKPNDKQQKREPIQKERAHILPLDLTEGADFLSVSHVGHPCAAPVVLSVSCWCD